MRTAIQEVEAKRASSGSAVVSLVTPTYNQSGYLAATIDSVLAQTHDAIDYRVIDDGSTDRTPEVLTRYDGRVRHERQANVGQSRTLNRAWDQANGKYLGYLSSDDLLHPTAIERAVDVLDRDPSVVCVFPNVDSIDPNGRVLKRAMSRPFDYEAMLVEHQDGQIGPGAVFRADAYRAVGGWRTDLRLGPDREFWLRLSALGRIHFIPDVLAGYRLHSGSISFRELSEAQSREHFLVLDDVFGRGVLPARIAARRDEAYAHANLVIARNQVRAGRLVTAWRYWRDARRLAPRKISSRHAVLLARAMLARVVRSAQIRLAQAR